MAKKISSAEDPSCDYSPRMYLDFSGVKAVEGVAIGQKVHVVIRGTVKSITTRERDDEGESAEIAIEDFTSEIVEKSEIEKLFSDED